MNTSDLDHLKTLNNRNAHLEQDILRMRSKQEKEKQLKLLKAQIPLVKYTEANNKANKLKNDYTEAKEKLQKIKIELQPVENVLRECSDEKTEINKLKNEQESKYKSIFGEVKKESEKIKNTRANLNSKKIELERCRDKLPEREKQIETLEKKISYFENKLKEPPAVNTDQFEKGITEINKETNDLNLQSTEIQQKVKEASTKRFALKRELETKYHKMKELENVLARRLTRLKRFYPDTVKAYNWLKENRNQFEGKIYDPIVLLLNLKDPRYAAMIENAMGGTRSDLLREFVCEKESDYRKITSYLVDKEKWKVNFSWPDDLSNVATRPPISTEELQRKFDMDDFVINLIEAPEYIKRYLCSERKLHLYPVALKCTREREVVSSGIFAKFNVDQTAYIVKKSLYGAQAKQTTATSIRNAEYLSDSIDMEAQNNLKDEIRSIQASIQQADIVIKELSNEHDKIKQTMEEKRHIKEDLQAQKKDAQFALQRYNVGKQTLADLKEELVELKKLPEEDKKMIEQLEEDIKSISNQESELLHEFEKMLERAISLYEQRNLLSLQYTHLDAKFNAIRNYNRSQNAQLEEAEKIMSRAKGEYKVAERDVKQYMNECKEVGRDIPDDLDEAFKEILIQWKEGGLQITFEELDNAISAKQGEIDFCRFANPNSMKHYEERKIEIARLEEKIALNKTEIENYKNKISQLRDQWAPLIKDLVRKINDKFTAAFHRIHCVGEVRVQESEDFDKWWGINIYVKFRDNEKLQLLTGQRQSGGERSVTTILYLMSLQDLAKSPFRVVDEINQGMDPRNERMIHEQIVQGASRPGTSQYFLITPKLLPNLFYNERIRILCIYNGEWVPEKIKPLSHYLTHARNAGIA
ncbi:MAG: hypothetical protein EXX96DRAFT_225498 [Benjaminiella poitrasii]|nr:MAG: hypothetical protein EXX96DRAFT_225498 [Benjaminiella poitrasii]